ncbi:hypothetical protein LZ31DRAFT_149644 [Colletotrichum somersetense]|nr:hypothetical protein LZ31DRAFT_149644 [Colletotrichum somersetense]
MWWEGRRGESASRIRRRRDLRRSDLSSCRPLFLEGRKWRQMNGVFGNVRRPNCVVACRVVDEKIFVVPVRDRVRLYGVEIAAEIGPSRCVDSFAFVFFFLFYLSLSAVAADAGNGGAWS